MTGLYLGLVLYNLLAALAGLLASPFLAAACLLGGKWRERCGMVPRTHGRPVWVHAASVGEVMMIRPLLAEIHRVWPDREFALSTMTGTGREAALSALGEGGQAFFFPLDFPWSQLRALGRLRPEMVVVCETELWPNLMWLCWLQGIPIFLVNARLSGRSLPYYRALRFLFGPLLAKASLIACQSQADSERYRMLAGKDANIMVAGNIKHDSVSPPSAGERANIRSGLGLTSDDLVLVAGSTHEGEEGMILEAWQLADKNSKIGAPNEKLILAPRHPDRFERVAAMLKERGLDFGRRSRGEGFSASRPAMLWDTMGELMIAYGAGDMAFVGGSLVPVGGHNPLEPAAAGLPVAFGPHMFNAAESARVLTDAGGAVQAGSAGELRRVLRGWVEDGESRLAAGSKAKGASLAYKGAARRTVGEITRLLGA